ncbi:MAG: CehA/McbA family metallohydrolase, partial [Myxococcota bacterium]
AAKLSVLPIDDTSPPAAALHESRRYGLRRYRPSVDGDFAERLPVGRYRVYVSRGFEFSRFEQEVEIRAESPVEIAATLIHEVDTGGLLGAEFHQHSLASVDANVPLAIKVMENAAEGVEVAASTDHDNIADFRPVVDALGLSSQLLVMAGNEVSYNGIGHFNVYPWDIDPADPLRDIGSRVWWQKTIPELFADLRGLAGDPVIQVNHPRSSTAGYFGAMLWNPTTGETEERGPPGLPSLPATIYEEWSDDFEALEVNDSLGAVEDFTPAGWQALGQRAARDPGSVPVLADWFGLLGKGKHVAAMGNSDSHELNGGVGYPRNFLRLGVDAPAGGTYAGVREAIRTQRVSIGNGCLAEFWAGEERPMGVAEALNSAVLPALRLRVQSPSHVEVDALELYVNGLAQPLSLTEDELVIEAAGTLSVELSTERRVGAVVVDARLAGLPTGDIVVVAIARGGGSLRPIGDGQTFCLSAPLYIDDEGDGWRGWLEGDAP